MLFPGSSTCIKCNHSTGVYAVNSFAKLELTLLARVWVMLSRQDSFCWLKRFPWMGLSFDSLINAKDSTVKNEENLSVCSLYLEAVRYLS